MRLKYKYIKTPVIKYFVSESGKTATFWCPYCCTWHTHGNLEGYRVSHCHNDCWDKTRNYYLKPYTQKELREIRKMVDMQLDFSAT